LPERDGRIDRTDLPDTLSGIFLKARLDDPNHVEMAGQIAVCAQRVFGPISQALSDGKKMLSDAFKKMTLRKLQPA
jgi:hypothetical protein